MSNQILLSLSGACLGRPLPRKGTTLALLDMPPFVAEELELRGLALPVDLIRGHPAATLEKLRHIADRAHCPCLVLYQDEPMDFCAAAEASTQLLRNLGRAAKLLGCGELAIRVVCPPTNIHVVAGTLKNALGVLQQFDVNLLIRPAIAPADSPEQLMDLVKKIGGFHIGAMPSFAYAHATGNGVDTLRKLAPYSSAIEATAAGFNKAGEHLGWDLNGYVEALLSFGYLNKISIDWTGATNWVLGVQKTRERLMELMGRGDPVG
ncbi:MAG: hypothetical protein EXS17_00350 [Phycisphaerales bacterium]|nr:hypothetical protein [Phycisphaerales bacterium]